MRQPAVKTELTAAQQAAADVFVQWLAAPLPAVPFVLTGYAGTGKTFLSVRLLQMVERAGQCWTTCAPTHKAVGVLNDHLRERQLRPTWYPSTIHRLLHLKVKRVDGAEVCEETDQTADALQNLGLVLVDEASMVDSRLLSISLRCAQCAGDAAGVCGGSCAAAAGEGVVQPGVCHGPRPTGGAHPGGAPRRAGVAAGDGPAQRGVAEWSTAGAETLQRL